MQKNEFAGKSRNELEAMVAEDRAKLHEFRIKLSVGQMRDVREVRETRQRLRAESGRVSSMVTASPGL